MVVPFSQIWDHIAGTQQTTNLILLHFHNSCIHHTDAWVINTALFLFQIGNIPNLSTFLHISWDIFHSNTILSLCFLLLKTAPAEQSQEPETASEEKPAGTEGEQAAEQKADDAPPVEDAAPAAAEEAPAAEAEGAFIHLAIASGSCTCLTALSAPFLLHTYASNSSFFAF